MPATLNEKSEGRVLEVHVTGKLTRNDYATLVPAVERLIAEHGKISMLFDMHDFHGWEPGALWEDGKFAMKHFSDIGRLAVVGEKRWQKGMAVFCRPFTKAKIRYFDHNHEDEANVWLQE